MNLLHRNLLRALVVDREEEAVLAAVPADLAALLCLAGLVRALEGHALLGAPVAEVHGHIEFKLVHERAELVSADLVIGVVFEVFLHFLDTRKAPTVPGARCTSRPAIREDVRALVAQVDELDLEARGVDN